MRCILRRCDKCPSYRLFDVEKNLSDRDPLICFHFFQKIAKCSIHGIFRDGVQSCPECLNETCPKKLELFRIGNK